MAWTWTKPHKLGWVLENGAKLYAVKFVGPGFDIPGQNWQEAHIQFYAHKPTAACRMIAAGIGPVQAHGQTIN